MALTFYSGKILHKVTTPRRLKYALHTGKLLSGKNSAYTLEEQAATYYLLPCPALSNLSTLNTPLFPESGSTIKARQLADEPQITTYIRPKKTALDLTASKTPSTEASFCAATSNTLFHSKNCEQTGELNSYLNDVSHAVNIKQALKQEISAQAQISNRASAPATAKQSTTFNYLWYVPCRPKITFSTKEALKSYVASNHADLSLCDISQLEDLSFVFYASTRQNWEGIEEWQTSQVVNFAHMFDKAAFFQASIESWDMRSAQDLTMMFAHCPIFNTPLQHWQTGNVRSMAGMFYKASAFAGEIGGWNTQNVVDMQHMFHDALLFDGCLYHWDTHKVRNFAYMFCNAKNFSNRLNSLSGWNMESARDLRGMLSGLSEQCKLDLSYMFIYDKAQIQGIFANSHAMVKGWERLYKIAQHTKQDLFEI